MTGASISQDDPVSLEQLSEEELRDRLESQLGSIRDRTKILKNQVWDAIKAGHILLALKRKCHHGEFDAAKVAKGLNQSAAHRYMSLAKSPNFSQCKILDDIGPIIDQHEWRSMRNILDAHGLAATRHNKLESIDIEIEDVEMCRFSGGYLFRCSVTGDPRFVGERVEVAMETREPLLARTLRDFGVRLLDAIGILPDRTRSKWQAYKDKEAPLSPDDDETRRLITQVITQVEALNMADEFGALYPALQDYLKDATD